MIGLQVDQFIFDDYMAKYFPPLSSLVSSQFPLMNGISTGHSLMVSCVHALTWDDITHSCRSNAQLVNWLDKATLPLSALSAKWFMCMFCGSLPTEVIFFLYLSLDRLCVCYLS